MPAAPIIPYQRAGLPPPRPPRNPLRGALASRISSTANHNPAPVKADTYASTAKKAVSKSSSNAEHLVKMARAAPATSPSAIVKMHKAETGRPQREKGKASSCTVHGPSRKQVLTQFPLGVPPPRVEFQMLQRNANAVLASHQSTLRVKSGELAYVKSEN